MPRDKLRTFVYVRMKIYVTCTYEYIKANVLPWQAEILFTIGVSLLVFEIQSHVVDDLIVCSVLSLKVIFAASLNYVSTVLAFRQIAAHGVVFDQKVELFSLPANEVVIRGSYSHLLWLAYLASLMLTSDL